MEEYQLIRKWLAIGIILLFVGVTLAPSINFNTVKATQEDDFIEVTSQACGIQGYGDTTVKLTREQYQNLKEYLNDFDARLNQTTTKEEVIALYKEAIVELNNYGLLPKGMSIPLVERLVIGNNLYDKLPRFFKHLPLFDPDDIENMKCFVYAEGDFQDIIVPLWFIMLLKIGVDIGWKLYGLGRYLLFVLLLIIGNSIFWAVSLFSTLNPIHILSDVFLNRGKLTTISFYPYKIFEGDIDHEYELFGFTGLKLIISDIWYFLGRTLFVVKH